MNINESDVASMTRPSNRHFLSWRFRLGWPVGLIFGAFLILGHPPMAHAERFIAFEIRLEGNRALSGFRLDDGLASPDVVWDYLKTIEFTRPRNAAAGAKGGYVEGFVVTPDADDPLRATVTGNLQISCRYGGSVEVKSLKLVRKTRDAEKWQVAPDEFERISQIRKQDAEKKPGK